MFVKTLMETDILTFFIENTYFPLFFFLVWKLALMMTDIFKRGGVFFFFFFLLK